MRPQRRLAPAEECAGPLHRRQQAGIFNEADAGGGLAGLGDQLIRRLFGGALAVQGCADQQLIHLAVFQHLESSSG
jgi:hypothetical protein